jgi:hypothetical protein
VFGNGTASTQAVNAATIALPTPLAVTPGNTYYLRLGVSTTNTNNYYRWPVTDTNSYAGGQFYRNTTGQSGDDARASLTFLSPLASASLHSVTLLATALPAAGEDTNHFIARLQVMLAQLQAAVAALLM